MDTLIAYYNSHGFEGGDDPEALAGAIRRAVRVINIITDGKYCARETLEPHQQRAILQAVCNQAEENLLGGYAPEVDYSVSVGGFTYKSEDNGVVKNMSGLAVAALRLAGLLSPAAGVRS